MTSSTPVEEEDDQNRFKLIWGILKKLVGVRDIVSMRVSVPAQLLEPMSNLEYWNYMDRPDYFACLSDPEEPLERMLGVIRWWFVKDAKHVHGRLVKPYNSTLGEQFLCRWHVPKDAALGDACLEEAQTHDYDGDAYTVTCITEQISHHPPVSAFQYTCEEKGISAFGIDHLCIGFSGTSIKIAAGDQNKGIFIKLDTYDEEYQMTHPHAHVNGWLRGALSISMADRCIITCSKSGLKAVLEYKEEKWLGRAKHAIQGKVFRYDPAQEAKDASRKDKVKINDADVLATLSGSWREKIYYTLQGTKEECELVDLTMLRPLPKIVRPLEEQSEHESRRIWHEVSTNIMQKNFAAANRAKHAVEEHQRRLAHERKHQERAAFESAYFEVLQTGYPTLKQKPARF
ncbi:putative oxysterol-binding protein [Thamnocephalis sphaerospora]|uniref:Putative oxysterol-binding protein n=1 Tax=Thamnocephalis sphaerospora TaxID=78915 RepID=A0A4P9XKA6_9FUNG|nr:putative oxysterol-binding protein [Thamnocephalis sphaerospora]|eukprot:RKP05670.1 putative oxysterol-binding protein [Thamnocephalis sphaerospora]